ncbi:hypothetical protein SDC9_207675 [bioreactor metagenome]|uniref:Uncharacterized protein n=1 Tax=bioreactor metagenome TaxID=1076179 RepID=A0A645JA15_9ZZZZ
MTWSRHLPCPQPLLEIVDLGNTVGVGPYRVFLLQNGVLDPDIGIWNGQDEDVVHVKAHLALLGGGHQCIQVYLEISR